MDKSQKQLIDTYFRKREIAAQMDAQHYGYTEAEVKFMLANPSYIKPNKLNGRAILQILNYDPSYIKKFKPFLYKLHGKRNEIRNVIEKHPELKSVLGSFLDRRRDVDIEKILSGR